MITKKEMDHGQCTNKRVSDESKPHKEPPSKNKKGRTPTQTGLIQKAKR